MQGVTNLHNGDYHGLAVHSGAFGGGVLGGELGAAAGVFTVTLVGATGPVGIIIVVGGGLAGGYFGGELGGSFAGWLYGTTVDGY